MYLGEVLPIVVRVHLAKPLTRITRTQHTPAVPPVRVGGGAQPCVGSPPARHSVLREHTRPHTTHAHVSTSLASPCPVHDRKPSGIQLRGYGFSICIAIDPDKPREDCGHLQKAHTDAFGQQMLCYQGLDLGRMRISRYLLLPWIQPPPEPVA